MPPRRPEEMSPVEVLLARRDSPARARSLFTVRAAISSATPEGRPRVRRPSFTCWYCRSRLLPQACCGIGASFPELRMRPDQAPELTRWLPGRPARTSQDRPYPEAPQDRRVALDEELLPLRCALDPERRRVGWAGPKASNAVVSDPCTVRATSEPACRDVRAIFSAASMLARTASSAAPKATSVR